MTNKSSIERNWFDQGGRAYARFRPEYPPQLAADLADLVAAKQLAVDVGCGNGQLTCLLAAHFETVLGVDASADQIANTVPHERIRYQCGPAEQLPLGAGVANLITAAQAAHWFKLPAFYQEARRVAAPGCLLALISYGVLQLEPDLNERFQTFYRDEIGPYWPPERALVDSAYATIDFPFEEVQVPARKIRLEWRFSEFWGYLLTWSAVRHAQEAGCESLLRNFAEEMSALWGDENRRRVIAWPINMRVGRL